MTQKAQTQDERFLVRLYEEALKKGDPLRPMNYHTIAKLVGIKETAMKNIFKHLAQANLVQRIDDTMACLTKRGCELALEFLSK